MFIVYKSLDALNIAELIDTPFGYKVSDIKDQTNPNVIGYFY